MPRLISWATNREITSAEAAVHAAPDQRSPMFFVGGYYNDKLIRTTDGWRITERIEDLAWNYGEFPGEIELPK